MQALLLGMVLALPQVDGLEKKIPEFEVVARPIDEALKTLSIESGKVILATDGIGREPVIVRLRERSVRQIMDELAAVCGGEWVEKNGAWTLKAVAGGNDDHSAVIASLEKSIRERNDVDWGKDSARDYIKKVNEGREKLKNNIRVGEAEQAFVYTEGNGMAAMGGQVLNSAMRQLGGAVLAQIPVGQRRVWSTIPNRRQLAFPGNLSQAVQNYRQVVLDVAQEAKSNPPSEFGFKWEGDFGVPSTLSADVSKVNIMAYRSDSAITVGIQLVGRNGEELLLIGDQLLINPPTNITPEEATGDAIPLSAASQQIVAVNALNSGSTRSMAMMMNDGDNVVRLETGRIARSVKVDPALQSILDSPAQVDFLNLFVMESFDSVVEESEYVVLVPDQIWSEIYAASRTGDLRESEVKSAYSKWTTSSTNNGVRKIKPKNSLAARTTRIRRDDLGRFISDSNSKGYAKLQDGARYVQSRGRVVSSNDPDALLLGVGQPFLAELLTRTLAGRYQNSALLGAAPDLVTISPGRELNWGYAQMSSMMKAALESLLYNQPVSATMGGSTTGISVNTEAPPPKMASDSEATERYPNGIPGDYSVSLSIREEEGILGRIRGQQTGRMLTAVDFGAIYGFTEGQGGDQGEFPITQFEEYLKATVRAITINLPGGSINYTDGQLAVRARAMSVSEIDRSFLERGQFARDAMRQAAQQMGNRGQQQPPPN